MEKALQKRVAEKKHPKRNNGDSEPDIVEREAVGKKPLSQGTILACL